MGPVRAGWLNFYLVELGGGAVDRRCVRDGRAWLVETALMWFGSQLSLSD